MNHLALVIYVNIGLKIIPNADACCGGYDCGLVLPYALNHSNC